MKDCHWLKPVLVAQIEFVEWTADNHLRHSKFIALRDDKKAKDVNENRPDPRDTVFMFHLVLLRLSEPNGSESTDLKSLSFM